MFPHSSHIPSFDDCLSFSVALSFPDSSLIFVLSAISSNRPGSIFRMSLVVIIPITFLFWITGNRRILYLFSFLSASVMSRDGLIVMTFRFIRSLAGIFDRSSFDFFTRAQIMSFSVRMPSSLSSLFFIIREPTLFLIMSFAQSLRFVSGDVEM